MEKFSFQVGDFGFCDETGYLEANELVEKFEWWLKNNDDYFEPGQEFYLAKSAQQAVTADHSSSANNDMSASSS